MDNKRLKIIIFSNEYSKNTRLRQLSHKQLSRWPTIFAAH